MSDPFINMYSDTVTRPTPAMRQAIAVSYTHLTLPTIYSV